MKKNVKSKALCCLLLFGLCFTTACVDHAYDLSKEIDKTITIGGDLVTPVSSTEKITLNDLFNIDYSSSNLDTLNNGDFILRMNGNPTYSHVKVNDVSIERTYTRESSKPAIFLKQLLTDGESLSVPIEDLSHVWNLNNYDVPNDVVDLEFADAISHNDVSLTMSLQGGAKGVWLKQGLYFTFPSYLVVDAANSVTQEYFLFERGSEQTKMILKKDFHLLASGTTWMVKISKAYFKSVNGIVIPNGQGFIPATANKGAQLSFHVPILVKGFFSMKQEDFPAGMDRVSCSIVSHLESGEMKLGRVRGKIDPKINYSISDVYLNNLPKFLTENDVNADLNNPQVLLRIQNTSEIELNFYAAIQSYKNSEKVCSATIGTNRDVLDEHSLRLKPSCENLICISPVNKDVPAGYTWVKCDNLSTLFHQVPDMLRVENIDVTVIQDFYTVDLGQSKNINTDYNIQALLEFGKDFAIVYQDTISGWQKDLNQFKMKEVEASCVVHNCIPLNLNIKADAIDANGNKMQDVAVQIEGNINAGTTNAPGIGNLKFIVKHKEGKRIEQLDGLIIRLEGKALQEGSTEQWNAKVLNAGQTLKFEDFKLGIKGGVTLDMN